MTRFSPVATQQASYFSLCPCAVETFFIFSMFLARARLRAAPPFQFLALTSATFSSSGLTAPYNTICLERSASECVDAANLDLPSMESEWIAYLREGVPWLLWNHGVMALVDPLIRRSVACRTVG
jgi:hypothetical protein